MYNQSWNARGTEVFVQGIDELLTHPPDPGDIYTQTQLDYLVDLTNYMSRCIEEYREGKRDKRNTPAANQERLVELTAERDQVYYDDLCEAARQLGYEWLPFPAVPRWQGPGGHALYLSYEPAPRT